MNTELQKRGIKAAIKLLENNGCENIYCLNELDFCQLVANRGEALVFITVSVVDKFRDVSATELKRDQYEKCAVDYLHNHSELYNVRITFDDIQIVVTAENRALVRHSENILILAPTTLVCR